MKFATETRKEVVEANPGAKLVDIARLLGERWKGMTAEEKAPWEALAREDKERYARELAEYNSRKGLN